MEKVYADHAATSPMHPDVIKKMSSVMLEVYGNPSSIHSYGREARHYLDEARTIIASSIGANFNDIIFTSGGTEADNMAIIGVAKARQSLGKHIITTQIEHHAVLHVCQQLEKQGFDITYLPVDEHGIVAIQDVKEALRDDTILVTMMYGNNEVGAIQPIQEIGELLANHQAYFHTDAVQAYGLLDMNVRELKLDLLSISGHKINGPKGIGFLYTSSTIMLEPTLFGGEQERKRRAGTENVPAIVGLAEAVKIAKSSLEEKQHQYNEFRTLLINSLNDQGVEFVQNGLLEQSLPHVLNLSFPGTDVESMLVNLDMAGIAASSGSACTAGSIEPSHVLVAMFGKDSDRVRNSIRFSFGISNTTEQVQYISEQIGKIISRIKG